MSSSLTKMPPVRKIVLQTLASAEPNSWTVLQFASCELDKSLKSVTRSSVKMQHSQLNITMVLNAARCSDPFSVVNELEILLVLRHCF